MNLSKKLLLVAFGLSLMSSAAMAGQARYSILGGVNKSMQEAIVFPGGSIEPALGYEGGLEAAFHVSPHASIDLAAMYLTGKVKTTVLGVATTTSNNFVDIPVIVRFYLGHVFSLGAGGYYDIPLTSGGTSDYGYVGSARFSFGSIFLDGRYAGGLKSSTIAKTKAWEALIGFTFGGTK